MKIVKVIIPPQPPNPYDVPSGTMERVDVKSMASVLLATGDPGQHMADQPTM